ncbi:MAG TPA: hypothetical protein VMH80_27025 [Bryobacteraceae bacterium]|nr:hypothetical protein [Bryobacteraceae bacterium]
MPLGNIAKQIAQQAIGNQVKEVLAGQEAQVPGNIPAGHEAESISGVILAELQAMQRAAKENEELVILLHNGIETLRVLEIFVPSPDVIVLAGLDAEKNVTRVVSSATALQLTCKVRKLEPEAKATAVRFLLPKPKAK